MNKTNYIHYNLTEIILYITYTFTLWPMVKTVYICITGFIQDLEIQKQFMHEQNHNSGNTVVKLKS